MARFAGSQIDFTPPVMTSAAGSSGAAAAAGVVDVSNPFASLRSKEIFKGLSEQSMLAKSAVKQAGMKAESDVWGMGAQVYGQTFGKAMEARAIMDAAEKESQAAGSSALMGGIGQIASAAIPLLMSDESTKTDIKRIDTALEKLRSLKPVSFRYKPQYTDTPERLHHGFIAQEFQEVLPDATYVDDSIGKLCIDAGDVIGLLVRAYQELEAKVGMLEAKQALATV